MHTGVFPHFAYQYTGILVKRQSDVSPKIVADFC